MTHARDAYLEAQLITATPQSLRLSLIDGAIRFARLTLQHWEHAEDESAVETLIRCENITAELLASASSDPSELGKRMASIYLFVLKHLAQSQQHRDAQRLVEVIAVLEVERETWRQVCEVMPSVSTVESNPSEVAQQSIVPTNADRLDDPNKASFSSYA